MNGLRIATAALLATLGLLAAPAAAAAHPLGNFTTNQYAGIRVTAAGVDVDYVLDLAELPAYQARREEIDTDRDGQESAAERDRYAGATCAGAAAATGIVIAGRTAPGTARPASLTYPAGTGGLATLRLECALHYAGRISDGTTIAVRAGYLPDRIGWREITAIGDRYTLTRSAVPGTSVSARLTGYPRDTVTSDVRSADLVVRPGGPPAPALAGDRSGTAAERGADRFTRWFTGLVGHPRLTWGVGILAILIALVLGGAHAVAPGHGKTIMAAYLVGTRGRIGHALVVAGTVAATHTAGVLALGVLLAMSVRLAPQHLYEWLRLASGLLIAAVGAHLLYRAILFARRHRHEHHHDHHHQAAHTHTPAARGGVAVLTHEHGGGRPHTHQHPLPATGEPFRLRTLLVMGFAGGLSPSPSAVVVLLGAAALGRAWYGVLLVLAYGIGLAVVLAGIGLALARWGERLQALGSGWYTRAISLRLPAVTAAAILLVGLGMAALAVSGLLPAG